MLNDYYYKHLKKLEAERNDEISNLLNNWIQTDRIKTIARDEARKESKSFLDAHNRDIQIEVDKRSIQAVRDALYRVF